MEYPFKLSEIIAGCESGAWLEGAVFKSEGNIYLKIFTKGEIATTGPIDINEKWDFVKYED